MPEWVFWLACVLGLALVLGAGLGALRMHRASAGPIEVRSWDCLDGKHMACSRCDCSCHGRAS